MCCGMMFDSALRTYITRQCDPTEQGSLQVRHPKLAKEMT